MKKVARTLAVTVALGMVVAACGTETAAPDGAEDVGDGNGETDDVQAVDEDVLSDVPDDAELVIYGAIHEGELARLADAFENATGIPTEFIRASAGEAVARIQAESENPNADVLLGGPSESHEALVPDFLAQYESPEALEHYDGEFYSSDHYWHGFYIGALGLAINTERWEDEFGDQEMPSTWDDLLGPEYEDAVVIAEPASSGTAYNMLVTQVFRLGEDEAFEWFDGFSDTVGQYTTSGAAPARMAGAGEYTIGIAFGHDVLKPIDAGYPLELIYPEDTGYEIGAVSIIDDGPNPEAARVFVDWMLGQEANQLHTDLSMRAALRDDVALPDGAIDSSELDLVDGFDAEWAGQVRDELLDRWEDEIA